MNEEFLKELVGDQWYQQLKDFLHGSYFSSLGNTIARYREVRDIYPEKKLVFRAFKETPYNEVKVVLIAMDPYNNSPDAPDGLAFSNSRAFKASQSIKIILEEIDREYPEWIGSIEHGRLGNVDLKRWAGQGVFLYNTALTVEKEKAGSHLKLWEPFTKEVIKALNKKNDLVWILLGNDARKLKYQITNQTHAVIEAPHPAAEAYSGGKAGFFGSNVFRKVNEELEARNKQIIIW